MNRIISFLILVLVLTLASHTESSAQCPTLLDAQGNAVENPTLANCSGGGTIFLSAGDTWSAFTVDWGDDSELEMHEDGLLSGGFISHDYPTEPGTYTATLTEDTGCERFVEIIIEEPANASIQIPLGGITSACAPQEMAFLNSSTDVSPTTSFTWNFGDGSEDLVFDASNSGQTVSHLFEQGTVDCETSVILTAENHCNTLQGGPSTAEFNPILIWDVDEAEIEVWEPIICYPIVSTTVANATVRNCHEQGNNAQRFEMWNFGDLDGDGIEETTDWIPWPTAGEYELTFPGIGAYDIMLVDSSLCGRDTAYTTIVVAAPPVSALNLNGETTICEDEQLQFHQMASAVQYKWNFGTSPLFIATATGHVSYTFQNPGVYDITSVVLLPGASNFSGCADTSMVTVTVLPDPEPEIVLSEDSGCSGLTTVASGIGPENSTYTWNVDGINVPETGSTVDLNFEGIGTHVVGLTVTNEYGCSGSTADFVDIFPEPNIDFATSSVCEGVATTFTDLTTTSNGDPITGWHWTFGDGGESYSQNAEHTYAATGTYPVTLTVSTPSCEASMTSSVDVLDAPDLQLSADLIFGCSPLEVNLDATSSVNGTYHWDFGEGTTLMTGTSNEVAHTYFAVPNSMNAPTHYETTVTVTSGLGCSASETIEITAAISAQANFATDLTHACAPFPITLMNNSMGATGYEWDFGDGTVSEQTTPSHTYENTTGFMQPLELSLVALAANGCHDTASVDINVFPEAVFDLVLDEESGCAPVVMDLPAIVSASSHQWDFGDGNNSTETTPEHNWVNNTDEPITYTIAFTGMNAFGCPGTATADLTVNPQPIANFDLAASAGCAPFSIGAVDASTFSDQIEWSLPDGTVLGDEPTFENDFSTSTVLILTAIDDAGCSDSHAESIEVFPAAEINLDIPMLSDCSPLVMSMNATGNDVTNGTWDFGDGNTTNGMNADHSWINTGSDPSSFEVTFTGETGAGCSGTASAVVTVNPQPTADFSMSDHQGCAPLNVDLQALATQADDITWVLGDGTELSTTSGTLPNGTFTHQFSETVELETATYTLTLTATDDAGCTDTHSETLTVFPKAKFDIALPFDSACSPLELDLMAINGAEQGIWDLGDGATAEGIEASHIWSNLTGELVSHVVSFTGQTIHGCFGAVDTTVHVKPQPVAAFSMNNDAGCAPFDVTFTNNSLRADHYQWVYGNGDESNDLTSAPHDFSYAGDSEPVEYAVTLIAADDLGCVDSTTDSVMVYPEMIAAIEGIVEGCSPFSTTLSFAGTEASVVDWDFGNGSLGSGGSANVTFDALNGEETTFNVVVAAMSVHGCTDQAQIDVLVHPTPEADLTLSESAACAGSPIMVYNIAQNADSVVLDLGDGNVFVNPEFEALEISYTGEGERLISMDLYSDGGCSASSNLTHTVHPAAVAAFSGPTTACSPVLATFENDVVIDGTDYSWDLGDGNISDLASASQLYQNSGVTDSTFVITLTAATAFGCIDSVSHTLTVYGTPVADLSLSEQSGCYPLEVTFANQSIGATSATLAFGTGEVTSIDMGDSLLTHNYFNLAPSTVSYTALLTVSNDGGCTAMDEVLIEVSPAVHANFDVVEQGCSPVQAQFVNSSFGATEYFWDFGDGTQTDVSQPAHTFVNNGTTDTTFVVTLVAVSDAGCTDTTSVGLDVYPMPVALFEVDPSSQTYPATTVNISNASTFGNASTTTWNMGDGTVYEGANPPPHAYETWGTYFITATVDNGYCSDVATQTVEILAPHPVAAFSGGGEGCAPLMVNFSNASTHAVGYFWDFGDGSSTTETNPIHMYETPGVYNVRLVTTGYEGVLDEVIHYATVEVFPTAIAAFTASPNQVVAPDESVYFINGSSADVTEWLWNFGDGYLSIDPTPVHSYAEPGLYTVSLTVNNTYNCPSSITVENAVEAIPGGFMRFPTAFTPSPGGSPDGSYDPMSYDNDIFHPQHSGILHYELRVFNKWGEMIFVSHDPNIGWNGRVNGELARQDVYAWRASASFSDGHSVTKAGDVTLIFH